MSTEKKNINSNSVSSTSTTVMDNKIKVSVTPKISKPAIDVPVISMPIPEICIAEGCNNISVTHPEWDHEYCSIKCCYNHCQSTFQAWLANNKLSKTKLNIISSTQSSLPTQSNDEKVTNS